MFKVSSEERNLQFIYLLVFWIVMSIIFYFACFYHYSMPQLTSKDQLVSDLEKQQAIREDQNRYVKDIDSLSRMIIQYNPATSQVYLESSINYEFDELRRVQEAKGQDERYKIFSQLDDFFSMQYFDKKATWTARNNSESLKKNLEECEIGFQQKLNNLQIQEALKNNNK